MRNFLLAAVAALLTVPDRAFPAADEPPPAPREFRAAWIATVANIDWPSRPGLSNGRVKGELVRLLDLCRDLSLNAVVLQVRPGCDAFYRSDLEPWSEYLTGRQGTAPADAFDPLEFAVAEAHARGLQLHAWFNPYRARHADARTPAAESHVSKTKPEIVRTYGPYLWLDPGEPAAEAQFLAVIRDVVARYDVDGVHIDDYFYPYAVQDKAGRTVPFPDEESYRRAVEAGSTLSRDDWRRDNVNRLVRQMYETVHATKPQVLVGVSPFGIWRPGHPSGVTGFDQYAGLYADARLWWREGWADYFTPQLYWPLESQGQPYAKLLAWWQGENVGGRHLWPGNFTSRVTAVADGTKRQPNEWPAEELLAQIAATRAQPGATGNVHFSMKALAENRDGLADKLREGPYREPALVPATTWLEGEPPGEVAVAVRRSKSGVTVRCDGLATGGETSARTPWLWLARLRTDDGWQTAIVPGGQSEHTFALEDGATPREVAASAVSRLGQEGPLSRRTIDDAR